MALEIASGISEDKLEQFTNLPTSNNKTFQWEEQDKEFRIADKIYDVVRIEMQDNKKIYYCIADTKEENNCSGFARLFNSKKDHNREGSLLKQLLKILLLDYNIVSRSATPVIGLQRSVTGYTLYQFLYHLHDCSVPSPPPWVV